MNAERLEESSRSYTRWKLDMIPCPRMMLRAGECYFSQVAFLQGLPLRLAYALTYLELLNQKL
jgi:hypothetical protein